MSGIFSKPKIPEVKIPSPPTPPPPPPTKPKDVEKVKEQEKEKLEGGKKRRRGTILTGPRGILSQPRTALKSLLGG